MTLQVAIVFLLCLLLLVHVRVVRVYACISIVWNIFAALANVLSGVETSSLNDDPPVIMSSHSSG